MNKLSEKYRKRLTENANQFDQIVIDICNEACKHKLKAERWRLQHKNVLANCNDVAQTFAAYREASGKILDDLHKQISVLEGVLIEIKPCLNDSVIPHYGLAVNLINEALALNTNEH